MTTTMPENLQPTSALAAGVASSCCSSRGMDDVLITALAHDLRAPLRNIRHLSRCLGDDLAGVTTAKTSAELCRLNRLAEKISRMVDELLLIRRSTASHVRDEQIRLHEMVRDSIDLGADPRHIRVEVTGQPDVFRTAKAALALILRNIIGNALRHHDLDRGTIAVLVSPQTIDRIEFVVRDDGPGLPAGMLHWLRSADDRAASTSPPSLGLVLARSMVEMHGGKISARSRLLNGRGTEIGWSWPISPCDVSCTSLPVAHDRRGQNIVQSTMW